MEKLVADQYDEGEETQLEVTEGEEEITVSDSRSNKMLHTYTQTHTLESSLFIVLYQSALYHTHYSFVGVLASLALMMKRGKRMENKQPLGGREWREIQSNAKKNKM